MLNLIITWSLRHRAVVVVLALVLAAVGAAAVIELPIDAFPDLTDVQVQVNTAAPSLAPEEVEKQITIPVEQVMGGIPGLSTVRSVSKFGLSQVTLVFEDGTDLYFARSQVLERLGSIELAEGLPRPEMGPIATGLGEVFHYIVTTDGGDLMRARTEQDWVLRPALSSKGVAEVNSWGGLEQQFHVVADPVRMVKYGVTLQELIEALERNNRNVGGGYALRGGEALLVQGLGTVGDEASISGVVVASQDGKPVHVHDVADVVLGHEIRRGAVTYDGRGEAVLGLGFMLMGENTREVTERLRDRLRMGEKKLEKDVHARVVYARTDLVDQVIGTVRKNLFEGALLVIAILFLFMGRIRAAVLVALAIPLSMLCAFNLMLRAGIAGSLMSLGAIDFGLIVDSSVIMVENVVRRLSHDNTGRSVREVVEEAALEVRRPTMFGELIIMIVYLPILTLEGVEGKLFRPMALTVIFALLGSMVLSLTLMPVLASLFLSRRSVEHRDPLLMRIASWLYRPCLRWATSNPMTVILAAVISLAGAAAIVPRLGQVFVPRLSEGSIVINTIRLAGASVEEAVRYGMRLEALLKTEFPDEIDAIWTRTGTAEVATDPMGIEVSDIFIELTPRARWKKATTQEELEARISETLKPMPGMRFVMTQPIEMRMNEMISGVRADLGVKVYGEKFDPMKARAERISAILNGVQGADDFAPDQLTGLPVLQVRVDRAALARYGVSADDVLDVVECIGGRPVGEVLQGQRRFPLAVRLPDRYRTDPALLGGLVIATPSGSTLSLSRLATIKEETGPTVINRIDRRRCLIVQGNVRGRDLGSFVAEAMAKVEAEDKDVDWGGQYEHLQRATAKLAWVVPICLALIFVLLYWTYGTTRDSLRVYLGVPFSAVGGILALYLRGMPFSISAAVGFIALSGVSVLADMVMVSYIRRLLQDGLPLHEAVLQAAETRLRPVLMTALVASLGFLPMAIATGVGAEVQRPLATVVIGGLVSSTLLSLLVLPAVYLKLGAAAGGTRE
ncbi:MAG: CusA/CzcA family heavy metal efflux RND transporter [Planctomycetota bacterium]